MTRFHLMRHGQIKANKSGHWHGSTDSPLTFMGRRQARRASKHVATLECTAVYASPLERCQHTARLATKRTDLEVQVIDDLQEMSIGDWEGISFRTLNDEYDLFANLKDPDYKPPQGESLRTVGSRVREALQAIDEQHAPEENILIVSHGVAMGCAIADLLHSDVTRWRDYHFDNCSLTELLVSPEPLVVSFNQTSHL